MMEYLISGLVALAIIVLVVLPYALGWWTIVAFGSYVVKQARKTDRHEQ